MGWGVPGLSRFARATPYLGPDRGHACAVGVCHEATQRASRTQEDRKTERETRRGRGRRGRGERQTLTPAGEGGLAGSTAKPNASRLPCYVIRATDIVYAATRATTRGSPKTETPGNTYAILLPPDRPWPVLPGDMPAARRL
eukprot:323858-Rhodomonas_salina.6